MCGFSLPLHRSEGAAPPSSTHQRGWESGRGVWGETEREGEMSSPFPLGSPPTFRSAVSNSNALQKNKTPPPQQAAVSLPFQGRRGGRFKETTLFDRLKYSLTNGGGMLFFTITKARIPHGSCTFGYNCESNRISTKSERFSKKAVGF